MLSGATPEQLAALRRADQDYAAKMAELGFKDREALAQLAVQEEQAYLADAQDARHANAANERVFWLGVAVLATFAGVCFGALWGAYALLTGALPVMNAAVVGMVSGFIGTVIGYVAANATQVVSFYFGSSKGSELKSEAMSTAFTQAFGSPAPQVKGEPMCRASPAARRAAEGVPWHRISIRRPSQCASTSTKSNSCSILRSTRCASRSSRASRTSRNSSGTTSTTLPRISPQCTKK
ncbi:hypothetical protein BGV71_06035 [Burkholderia ubonensis]|uniref:hypothetical protein n=1 Tax=Burkholderia ubonensis TaxID=101571 RepID=UPI0008FE0875|nr:hypothetical protein [Burkholderia ubonensis]OJA90634.1 hypothetical protein BGV71_06035 [Burkholderia ubonensis]